MKNILLIEDFKILRQGIISLLGNHYKGANIYETDNITEALKIVKKYPVEYIISDINLRGEIDGIEGTKKLLKLNKQLKVIMLSMFCDRRIIEKTMQSGAMAYICKYDGLEELINAIESAAQDKKYLSTYVLTGLYNISQDTNKSAAGIWINDKLTSRHFDIIHAVAAGLKSNEIAQKLNISRRTVEVHLQNIYKLLNVKNKQEMLIKLKL